MIKGFSAFEVCFLAVCFQVELEFKCFLKQLEGRMADICLGLFSGI